MAFLRKHFLYIVIASSVAVVLALGTWLYPVSGQDVPDTYQPDGVRLGYRHYLPLVLAGHTKTKSGIHAGNRGKDWNTPINFLTRFKGTPSELRPKAIVVLSNQLYNINRATSSPCKITGVSVRSQALFSFLTQSISEGTLVIIRLYPSPGNFTDYSAPGDNHTLRSDPVPAGGNYCNKHYELFRAVDDLAMEMNEIYKLNVNGNKWPAENFFFEPANEPNAEWYYPGVKPNSDNSSAWRAMDAYFAAVYDSAKTMNNRLQVLTPPMAQDAFAETRHFGDCTPMSVVGGGAGYDHMPLTYGSKNDGFSWHNYWRQSKELWSTANPPCSSAASKTSDHIFQAFPTWLQATIRSASGKYSFISEADLLSPCQMPPNPITNKDTQAAATQDSIWRFISEERGATVVVVWLLTNEYADSVNGSVASCSSNDEIAWHEAYKETGEREWFRQWWLREEYVAP